MATYKTPDVYVEEISTFPPSVAEVETAIPAFIGYTEFAKLKSDGDLLNVPTKIYSLIEYELYFGGPQDDMIKVSVSDDDSGGFTVDSFTEPTVSYVLYYSVKLYFDNGGGQCYIISVGGYADPAGAADIDEAKLQAGLDKVALEDEPTLIVIPEAVSFSDPIKYQTVVQAVLAQCDKLRDRFGIFDIYQGKESLSSDAQSTNRGYFGNNYLNYGAAYYPFIKTSFNFYVNDDESNVVVTYVNVETRVATTGALPTNSLASSVLTADAVGELGMIDGVAVAVDDRVLVKDETDKKKNGLYKATNLGSGTENWTLTRTDDTLKSGLQIKATEGSSNINKIFALVTDDPITVDTTELDFQETDGDLGGFETTNTALYNFVQSELEEHYLVLPPSGAVTGVYAGTDTDRGVWKAPANVSLTDVIEPAVKIDNTTQDSLNVDVTSGKSINAIRAFSGKGTLVWGARTLEGNSNEWRYISVRRFFIMVEESVKKSTYWAVFEPNDANTWVKVRGMIENYLTQKWREGALAGSSPQEAFYVKCGLGTTMTFQDILEGLMNVEIGMAAVRPAEFIVLKFSHKVQTS
jgi:phage tail sheath protein FI